MPTTLCIFSNTNVFINVKVDRMCKYIVSLFDVSIIVITKNIPSVD